MHDVPMVLQQFMVVLTPYLLHGAEYFLRSYSVFS